MEKAIIFSLLLFVTTATTTNKTFTNSYSLTVKVNDLRNSEGSIIIAIYNRDGTIPDEKFKDFYKKKIVDINEKKVEVNFNNLPKGQYAITVLHDENNNEKIDKKFILPKEGVGFSNYENFGLSNRPNFKNASFNLDKDSTILVKIIYK